MGFPEIQGCNPEITSCDSLPEAPFSAPDKAPKASSENASPVFFSKHWEKYQKDGGVLYNSLWAPTAGDAYSPESAIISQSERERVLGSYLANMPASPEELIPTDTHTVLLANTPNQLVEAWPHLPLQVRVYLEKAGLKGEKNLGIIYETENPNFPEGRWRVFNSEEDSKKQIAMAGMLGFGLFKSGSNSSGSSPKAPPPANTPSVNVKLGSFAIGTALIIGVDLGIKKAFPNLPSDARIFPNLGVFYGFQYIAWQAGFTKAATWGEVWRPMTGQLPMMAVLGIPTSALVDGLGKLFKSKTLRSGGDLHAPLSILGTIGLHYGLMKTVAGRNFLMASGNGLAGKLGSVAKVGGSALILSALCRGARAGGSYAGLWFGGARPGSYAWREGQLLMLAEKLSLAQVSKDVFGETGGGVIDGALGGLLDGILTIGELISRDVEIGRQMDVNKFRDKIRQEGEEASTSIREQLKIAAFNSMKEKGEIDWEKMQQNIAEIYSNSDVMESIYANFEMTGQNNDASEEIKLSIGVDGSIQDRDKILKIIRSEFTKHIDLHQTDLETLKTKQSQLLKLGEEIGYIQKRGDHIFEVHPAHLSPAQHQRMQDEYLPLAGEVAPLEILKEETDKMHQFLSNSGKK